MNKPLTGRYAKLRDDLIIALQAGGVAEKAYSRDAGTCNFDSPGLTLTRWNTDLVKQAAREAGTDCFKWMPGTYVFSPKTGMQGDPRTANAEAVKNKLEELGYDAFVFYRMD